MHEGPVGFLDGAVAELLGETGGGLRVLGEDDDAGDGPVESVGDAEVDLAGLVAFDAQILLHCGFEGREAGDGLGGDAGGFVGDEERPVDEEEHGERKAKVKRQKSKVRRRGWGRVEEGLCRGVLEAIEGTYWRGCALDAW